MSPNWLLSLLVFVVMLWIVTILGIFLLYETYQNQLRTAETTLRSYQAELLFKEQSKLNTTRRLQQTSSSLSEQKTLIADLEEKLIATEIYLTTALNKLDSYAQAQDDAEFQALKANARIQAQKLKRLTGEDPLPVVPRGSVQIRQIPPIPRQKPIFEESAR